MRATVSCQNAAKHWPRLDALVVMISDPLRIALGRHILQAGETVEKAPVTSMACFSRGGGEEGGGGADFGWKGELKTFLGWPNRDFFKFGLRENFFFQIRTEPLSAHITHSFSASAAPPPVVVCALLTKPMHMLYICLVL